MSQVITAYYDNRQEAEAVQNRLRELGILKDNADTGATGNLYHRESTTYREGHYSSHADRGIWADRAGHDEDYLLPDADRSAYEEGVHRGGAVLTVTVDDEMADEARRIIDASDAQDIDTKADEWRNAGWAGGVAGAVAGAVAAAADKVEDAVDGDHHGGRYYDRDADYSSNRYRTYRRTDIGNGPGETSYRAAGMANEAIGNVKQAAGAVVGSESLQRSGEAQERHGEQQQRTGERLGDQGNEL